MPNHKSKKQIRPRVRLTLSAIILCALALLSVSGVAFVHSGTGDIIAASISGNYFSRPSPVDPDGADYNPLEDENLTEPEPVDIIFNRPEKMIGAWIIPGMDYYLSAEDSGEAVKSQIDGSFEKLSEWKFNTVIMPMNHNGKPLYNGSAGEAIIIKNADGSGFDALGYILDSARSRGIYVYGVIDLGMRGTNRLDPTVPDDIAAINGIVRNAAQLYECDGYLLDGIGYDAGSSGDYAAYTASNPGTNFDNYMRYYVNAAVKNAVEEIKKINSNLYVGIAADCVWASADADKRGLIVSGVYTSLTDGHADTLGWIQSGLFDFVMVKNSYPTTGDTLSFNTLLDWWINACEDLQIPMYIHHSSDKQGTVEAGWKSPDQLSKQVLTCMEKDEWTGSLFSSVKSLSDNPGGSTAALLSVFSNTVNPHIGDGLVFTTPQKTSVDTYESQFNIRGSADPNFPLLMNGKQVEISEHGFFSLDSTVLKLAIGSNTYKFEHKGETVTYTVNRKVVVLKDIYPTSKIEADGGSLIGITAIAFRGSSVSAKVNGKTIAMKKTSYPSGEDGASSVTSDYDYFVGEYTLPNGIEGKTLNLGSVVISGSYQTSKEQKTGGQIVVKALPIRSTEDTPPLNVPGKLVPIDPSEGSGSVISSGQLVVVNTDYAETLTGTHTEDVSEPVNTYLPRGTTDVVVKSVQQGKYQYYLLGCGWRVYQHDVAIYKQQGTIKGNSASVKETKTLSNGDTQVVLDMDWRVPYNFRLKPQNYYSTHNISSFTATYADFTFSYTTKFSGEVDVSGSAVFKKAEWIAGSGNTSVLRLHLRETGGFCGYSSYWDENGNLILTFRKPTGLSAGAKPLSGKRIVIDPGHGGTSSGTAFGKSYEKVWTLTYSFKLREKLEALGATVVMTRTTDVLVDAERNPANLLARNAYARNNFTDLFVSMHVNAASASSARGSSLFYFNEYSMNVSKTVGESCKKAYGVMAPGAYNRSVPYQFARFMVMQIHDCPAILAESGFATNIYDLELMQTAKFNEMYNQAIVDGILEYFRNRPAPQAPT